MYFQGLTERKTVQVLVAGNNDLSFRAGAPGRDGAHSADDQPIFRWRNLWEIRTKFRELKKLENGPAHLEAVARKVRNASVSSADLYLAVRQLLVVIVGLIRKAKGVGLKIERSGPGCGAPESQDTD